MRLFVIHRDHQERFAQVETLEDLKQFTAGQGLGWADARILRHAGLDVYSTNLDNLFHMVDRKRIDYIPLGANEVFGMLDRRREQFPQLMVEQHLVLTYPFDFLYFVNKDNQALHDAIHDGLTRAMENGTFAHLLRTHPDNIQFVEKANLGERSRIAIENPLITPETARALRQYMIDF